MKRYGFLTLIISAMLVAVLLSACAAAPAITPAAVEPQAVAPTPAAGLIESPAAGQPGPTAAPTSQPTALIPVTAATPAPAANEATVTADALNLRLGPGLNHRILGQLAAGQVVSLQGRSQNSEWAAVRLPGGREGWVYTGYLSTSADLASLPVLEAYGGPEPAAPAGEPISTPSGRYRIDVAISANLAEVQMSGFAGGRDVTLRLVAPGEGRAVDVAAATTGAEGSADLSFAMPARWPDGSAVTQRALELHVLGPDGSLQGKAKITYYAAE